MVDGSRRVGYEAEGVVDIQPHALVGFAHSENAAPVVFAGGGTIRSHSVIYGDVTIGDHFQMGHHALIREHTEIGDYVMVGSHVVIDGHVKIGSFVKIQTACYIPTHTTIGNRVFLGPQVVFTNDRFPLKQREQYEPQGPVLEDGVTLGAGSVVLPGVVVGENSFVAAGAIVTRDVPPNSLVVGQPGRVRPLPDHLTEVNRALNWPPVGPDETR